MASDITADVNPAEGMLLMDRLGAAFAGECFRVVATAFKDPGTEVLVQKEISRVKKTIARMKAGFFNELAHVRK